MLLSMKAMSEWFEAIVENVSQPRQRSAVFLVILLVLVLGAGSLYMLLNTPS